MNQLPASLHDAVRTSFDDVVHRGRHLSTAFEHLFRELRPSADDARAIRTVLIQAVRYADIDAALRGDLDGLIDPDRAALPQLLRDGITQAYGDAAQSVIAALLADAPTFIRVNTLKTTVKECVAALTEYQPTIVEDDAVRIASPFGLFTSQAFRDGWFEQQDITSQRAGHELHVEPGQRIVDACAGAGGKTLLFAAAMKNRGRIIALDTSSEKLAALKQRCIRAGVDIVDARPITSTKTVKRLADSADGVFIDVPCSGTGVIRRNPDILMNLNEQMLNELITVQAEILRRNARIVRVGGSVVYATCSILPSEGKQQIEQFCASDEGAAFTLASEWSTLPGDNGGDGFYVARLTRTR